jgi:uncharacterized protein (DUF2147 family)
MNLKNQLKCMTLLWCVCGLSTAIADTLNGTTWVSMDDKTGKPRAVIQISEKNGVVVGEIADIYPDAGDTGICSKCPGEFKDKPIKGLEFLWGLKQTGPKNWEGGQILDAKTGKVYRVKMLLKGDKLYVRGFIGFSVLGRTQIWERKSK